MYQFIALVEYKGSSPSTQTTHIYSMSYGRTIKYFFILNSHWY